MLVHKYVELNGLTAMLSVVTPDMNLRILLHTGDKAYKQRDPSWF